MTKFSSDVKGRINPQPRRKSLLQLSVAPRRKHPTISDGCMFFFLDVGQYSPSNPSDDRKSDAGSDIKEASN